MLRASCSQPGTAVCDGHNRHESRLEKSGGANQMRTKKHNQIEQLVPDPGCSGRSRIRIEIGKEDWFH